MKNTCVGWDFSLLLLRLKIEMNAGEGELRNGLRAPVLPFTISSLNSSVGAHAELSGHHTKISRHSLKLTDATRTEFLIITYLTYVLRTDETHRRWCRVLQVVEVVQEADALDGSHL
jgi:hypothetical protein